MPDSIDKLANTPAVITWKGQDYKVTELELDDIAEFTAWAKRMAVVEADMSSLNLTERLREDMMRAVTRDINNGYYEPGAAGFVMKMGSPGGQAKILQLGLKKNHPDITFKDCQTMVLEGMLGMVFNAGYEPFGGESDTKKASGVAASTGPLPL